jgi:hypothetical protein
MSNATYLAHHGIKGQKWGIRRYQNPDGSLTDEGRRRYGFGKGAGGLMTQNTKERMLQGGKLGAKIGTGLGAVSGAVGIAGLVGAGFTNPAALVGIGAGYLASGAVSGTLDGLWYGGIIGAAETSIGRDYIKKYDDGLAEFEMRDLNRKKPVDYGKKITIVS